MRKAVYAAAVLLLLTGCWDQVPLRKIHLVDVAGVDVDKKNGGVIVYQVVTELNKAGQGEGEPLSETTELTGPSLMEAIGEGEYKDRGPFIGINSRIYLISKAFASRDISKEMSILLHAPYASINTPVAVYDGPMAELLKHPPKEFTNQLSDFINSLDPRGIMPTISMMHLILSQKEPLEDAALPLVQQSDSGIELKGALLFTQGKSSGKVITKEQVRILRLLLGGNNGRQRMSAKLSGSTVRRPLAGHTDDFQYAFLINKNTSAIKVKARPKGSPSIMISVKMKITVLDLGRSGRVLTTDTIKSYERELNQHMEHLADGTVKSLQQANADVLGIGKHLRAYHPDLWKSMNWREDYPRLPIKTKFNVQILNPFE
ncbi:Ger(x)C family spore germination protein [Paenibacillus gansuensis]|uniref:Ger(X)C family spore germination C-terminal domain-containing protein n=1 Tax=Paenibacillus gansuensis TaxID=306542 RepID=A0ABW5PAQ3_9BACL